MRRCLRIATQYMRGNLWETIVAYRIEILEYGTNDWVCIGALEYSASDIKTYLCIVKRMHPGSKVRAFEVGSNEMLVIV